MYTYADIHLQNKQDAFSAMYYYVSSSILSLCGARTGEGIIREAVRRAGCESGQAQLASLRQAGIKVNLHSLYHCGCDLAADPRVRSKLIFDEEDRQIWEIHTCPMADFWNNRDAGKLGSFFCEEFQRARVLAYTEGVGQLNLSRTLTCPNDNACCFSAYFREANMSPARAKESFAHCDEGYTPPASQPANASFDESIRNLTISIYYRLWETARERCGQEGVCAVAEGLKQWAVQAQEALASQADRTLMPLNAEFVSKNFPLSVDAASDPAWQSCPDTSARDLMQALVLTPIAAREV